MQTQTSLHFHMYIARFSQTERHPNDSVKSLHKIIPYGHISYHSTAEPLLGVWEEERKVDEKKQLKGNAGWEREVPQDKLGNLNYTAIHSSELSCWFEWRWSSSLRSSLATCPRRRPSSRTSDNCSLRCRSLSIWKSAISCRDLSSSPLKVLMSKFSLWRLSWSLSRICVRFSPSPKRCSAAALKKSGAATSPSPAPSLLSRSEDDESQSLLLLLVMLVRRKRWDEMTGKLRLRVELAGRGPEGGLGVCGTSPAGVLLSSDPSRWIDPNVVVMDGMACWLLLSSVWDIATRPCGLIGWTRWRTVKRRGGFELPKPGTETVLPVRLSLKSMLPAPVLGLLPLRSAPVTCGTVLWFTSSAAEAIGMVVLAGTNLAVSPVPVKRDWLWCGRRGGALPRYGSSRTLEESTSSSSSCSWAQSPASYVVCLCVPKWRRGPTHLHDSKWQRTFFWATWSSTSLLR